MFPFLYRLASASTRTVPFKHGKLATSFAGRRSSVTRWIEWASVNRTNRPLIWVHGASVGENLSATPVVARLRALIPGIQVVHSYTSPSAASWNSVFGGDQTDFLPPEEPHSIKKVFETVRPDLLVFSRGDIWPVLTQTAAAFGIPIAVIGGTVNRSSRRLWPLARRLLAPTYRSVSWIGAVSREHADRWISLGASAHSTAVTGDPRHDQVLERHTNLGELSPFQQWGSGSTVLVAGSTDKRDERVLLEAFSSMVISGECCARLMIAPHEVSKNRIHHLRGVASRFGIAADVWDGGAPLSQSQCIVVEKTGVLADLYALGHVAYVGGGFGRAGLHAVIEPAAFGMPVVAGPDHRHSEDFGQMLKAQGAIALPRRGAAEQLQRTWTYWEKNTLRRIEAGLRARRTLHQGAATASTLALLRLLRKSTA